MTRTTHVICRCSNILYAEFTKDDESRTVFVETCEKCNTNETDYDGVIGIAGFTAIDAVRYQARHPGTYDWRKLLDHLDKETTEETTVRLNLGCGDRLLEHYINIDKLLPHDKNLSFYVFRYGNVRLLTDFKDNSVDEIYASHVLDHLSRDEELDEALSRWYQILKPRGILRVAVSDFEKVVKMYNEGLDLERLWGHIVGGQKTKWDQHGVCFDYNTLKKYLNSHGFIDIKRYRWQDFLPKDFDDLSQAYIPHMEKNEGYLMSLNVQCKKPLFFMQIKDINVLECSMHENKGISVVDMLLG